MCGILDSGSVQRAGSRVAEIPSEHVRAQAAAVQEGDLVADAGVGECGVVRRCVLDQHIVDADAVVAVACGAGAKEETEAHARCTRETVHAVRGRDPGPAAIAARAAARRGPNAPAPAVARAGGGQVVHVVLVVPIVVEAIHRVTEGADVGVRGAAVQRVLEHHAVVLPLHLPEDLETDPRVLQAAEVVARALDVSLLPEVVKRAC